jgi:oxygen-independent coproporphyrinogen-3 oxidase
MNNKSIEIHKLLENRKNSHIWNTSYPIKIEDWRPYRTQNKLQFCDINEMSFYIHIPFCKQICTFCEYSKIVSTNEEVQMTYLNSVKQDILSFINEHNGIITLKGFDIGGGTPTALSEKNFYFLMDIYDDAVKNTVQSNDYEPSIEATFNTLSIDKLKRIVFSGIKRLSLGVQSTSKDVLSKANRHNAETNEMRKWIDIAWNLGIEKINLDLMYGLQNQTMDTIDSDLSVVKELNTQQVTLYELRTNMIHQKDIPNKAELYEQYCRFYDGLISLGYSARFGQNTFSKDSSDQGVSSYLRSRMLHGVPYKGFGISAQSMTSKGVSYNIGKQPTTVRKSLTNDSFKEEFTYNLPPKEIASKYIAIAAYNGSFSIQRTSELLGTDTLEYFKDELDYCISNDLLYIKGDSVFITKRGFKYYGAVFSLFYAKYLK